MVSWYHCNSCEKIVDEFEEDFKEDMLCKECRKEQNEDMKVESSESI